MPDESAESANRQTDSDRIALRRVELSAAPIGNMIAGVSIIAGIISMSVVVGVIFLAFQGKPIPDVLSNWGGIILGFYFGQFISLVKDYMGVVTNRSS